MELGKNKLGHGQSQQNFENVLSILIQRKLVFECRLVFFKLRDPNDNGKKKLEFFQSLQSLDDNVLSIFIKEK